MKIAIIGSHQSGKSTTFKILIGKDVSGNIGIFRSRDYRIEKISEIFSSKKRTLPEFMFVDIGSISDFKRKDISRLQDIDMFLCIIGAFFSEDPKKDFDKVLTDIIVSDLEAIQNRIGRLKKEKGHMEARREMDVLEKSQEILSDGNLIWRSCLERDDLRIVSGLGLLSLKPLILAINVSEENIERSETELKALEGYAHTRGIGYIRFLGKVELELLELKEDERKKFLEELGYGYNFREDISELIRRELSLVTFFTSGEKETRGWYLRSGLPVIEAAGKVHSDMKRGFIRAEVVNFEDIIKCGSIHKAREKGLLKVEGKDYVVKDGDIINVRFSV